MCNENEMMRSQWERLATARNAPRRKIAAEEANSNFFPASKLRLLKVPQVIALGPESARFLSVQSLYRYMHEIANVEIDVVCGHLTHIAQERWPVALPAVFRHEALTILVDEYYHAYVARDFSDQVRVLTGMEPVEMPNESSLTRAIAACRHATAPELYSELDVLTLCLSEHALTRDLIDSRGDANADKTFFTIMSDHIRDEGRHQKYFSRLLAHFWNHLAADRKTALASVLPVFFTAYAEADVERQFEARLLQHFSINADEAETIMSQARPTRSLTEAGETDSRLRQMMRLLQTAGLLEDARTVKMLTDLGLRPLEAVPSGGRSLKTFIGGSK